MSKVAISYDSLADASKEANNVAKKLGDYEDSLSRSVYNKLNSYKGSGLSFVSSAKSYAGSKIKELQGLETEYKTYSTDLTDLKTECQLVDKAVRGKVSALTASFKQAHGIRDSKIENAINFFLTDLGNKTAFGRFLGNVEDTFDAVDSAIKDHIKKWFNYEGGKELVTGALVGILEVVGGVIAIVGAILSGGALIVVIAGVVLGAIAVLNGIANILNEQSAYITTQNGDPATGRRRSDVNTWQDYFRSSFYFGDDGENYEYSKGANFVANLIDGIQIVATAITFVSGIGELCKKGFKWATGSASKMKDISFKQVFSKETFTAFGTKLKGSIKNGFMDIKTSLKNGFTDFKAAFRNRNSTWFKDMGKKFASDFGKNFMDEFWNFEDAEKSLGSIKNMIDIPKELLDGGFDLGNIVKTGFENIVIPCTLDTITVASVIGDNGTPDKIELGDLTGAVKDTIDLFKDTGSLAGNLDINKNIIEKFAVPSDLNVSIPDISVPQIEMPVLRTA